METGHVLGCHKLRTSICHSLTQARLSGDTPARLVNTQDPPAATILALALLNIRHRECRCQDGPASARPHDRRRLTGLQPDRRTARKHNVIAFESIGKVLDHARDVGRYVWRRNLIISLMLCFLQP